MTVLRPAYRIGLAAMGLVTLPMPASTDPSFAASAASRVVDLRLAGDAVQRVLVQVPDHARGAIVMLPGGAGELGIGVDGQLAHDKNFVVRTRDLWTSHGYAVLMPDAIDGASLRGIRHSAGYAAVVGRLVTLAHHVALGPVFLLGTSQGSIAAANGAAQPGPDRIAGLVLTEAVSRLGGSHETVFDADLAGVRVATLLVANAADACPVAPPSDAPAIKAALINAPDVTILTLDGGVTQTTACGSLSPHGYDGIEASVVDAIAAWMDKRQ